MAKIRVSELARELGVESRIVMGELQRLGEFVRSASSTLEKPVADRIRRELAGRGATARTKRVSWDRPGVTKKHPVRRPVTTSQSGALPLPRPVARKRERSVAIAEMAPLERLIARHLCDGDRVPGYLLNSVRAQAQEWARKLFDDRTAAPWLDLRMTPSEARQAADLGITPELMCLTFQKPGRALCGGGISYKRALERHLVSIPEIKDELTRVNW